MRKSSDKRGRKQSSSENKYNYDKSKCRSEFVHRRANRGTEEKIISAQTAVDSFRSLRTEFVSTRFRETRFSCRGPGEKIGRSSLSFSRATISEWRNYFRSQLADNELLNTKDGNCCSPFAKTGIVMHKRNAAPEKAKHGHRVQGDQKLINSFGNSIERFIC